jgi:imidazoleglycerol phosphate dehydratase HisB
MDPTTISCTVDAIKAAHAQFLVHVAAKQIEEFKTETAEELADKLDALRTLAIAADARGLANVHIHEKAEMRLQELLR